MKTTKIHLADQSFQSQHSENCSLLVRISPNRVSYAVVDQSTKQLRVLFDSPDGAGTDDIISLAKNDPFLGYRYANAKISFEAKAFTFIPDEIYADDDLESYAHFIVPDDRSEVLVKHIRAAGTRIIYSIPKHFSNGIKMLFSDPVVYSQASPLIESSFKLYDSTTKNIFVIQFNDGSFEALLMKKGKMEYYNIFSIENTDEFNYFLLNIIKQLNLNYQDTQIVLCGDVSEYDENYTRLKKYFNAISFGDISSLVNGIAAFGDIPRHQFFSLIGLNVCG